MSFAKQENTEFIYQTLADDGEEIRLLRLLENGGPSIECELAHFSIYEDLEYTALSYCWTQEPPRCNLVIDGARFWIRPNLYDYLEQAKLDGQHGWIFIDAICINQQDISERGRLVRLMSSVYKEAKEVVTWLGCNKNLSLATTHELQSICDTDFDWDTPWAMRNSDAEKLLVRTFCENPYWRRLWIVQEVAFAKLLTISYGPLRIQAHSLQARLTSMIAALENIALEDLAVEGLALLEYLGSSGSATMERIFSATPPSMLMTAAILQLRNWIQQYEDADTVPLSFTLVAFSRQGCAEAYDGIFGLLGLSNSLIRPNYRLPRMELYLRALFEGLLQHRRYPNFPMTQHGSSSPYVKIFCVTIMERLGLRPDQPAVAIVTAEALRIGHQPMKMPTISRKFAWQSAAAAPDRNRSDASPAFQQLAWATRSLSTHYRLKRSTAKQALIPGPDTGQKKSYDDWIAYVQNIYSEIDEQTR